MHLSQVDCSGSEFRIFDCSYKTDAANECGSNQNSGPEYLATQVRNAWHT